MARRTAPPQPGGEESEEVRHAVQQAPDVDIGEERGRDDPILRARRRYQKAIVDMERERADLRELIGVLKVKLTELERHRHGVAAREARAAEREREFDRGFEQRRVQRLEEIEVQLEPLRESVDALRRQHANLQADIAGARAKAVAERSSMQVECSDERDRLLREANEAADAIVAEARTIAEQTSVAAQQQAARLRSDIAALDQDARARASGLAPREIAVEALEHDVADREQRLNQLVEERTRYDVDRYRHTAKLLGTERDNLAVQVSSLREQLQHAKQATRIDPEYVAAIERDNAKLNARPASLNLADGAKVARLEADLEAALAGAAEAVREAQRLKDTLRKHERLDEDLADATEELQRTRGQRDTLRAEAERMRADLDLLRGAAGSLAPDSELTDIDDDAMKEVAEGTPRLRQQAQLPNLAELVDETRRAMATLPDPRFYAERVVRCFVAGLAASQLHILEGISGTGKTSLPLAFAKALDAPCTVVEVQAAWRDRLDLVGHYSHLQRRYYSTPFARAVYRSAIQPWQQVPAFIVLDEMNLSHPEQYLADVLSAIERPDELHDIELLQADGKARGLLQKRRVALGPNVWFIGTANRDETTKTIADKTCDRAHIMSLPESHVRETGVERPKRHGAFPAIHLRKLFNEAATEGHPDTAWVAERVFHEDIRKLLAARRLGIGSRLRRQVKAFVPVYTKSGGKRLDALDHLFATKVVRRLESVFDLRAEHVDELQETLMTVAGVTDLEKLQDTKAALEDRRGHAEE